MKLYELYLGEGILKVGTLTKGLLLVGAGAGVIALVVRRDSSIRRDYKQCMSKCDTDKCKDKYRDEKYKLKREVNKKITQIRYRS